MNEMDLKFNKIVDFSCQWKNLEFISLDVYLQNTLNIVRTLVMSV